MSQERYDPKDPKFEAMPIINIERNGKASFEIGRETTNALYRYVKVICDEYEKTKEFALKTLLEMKMRELGYEVEIDGDGLLKAVVKATPMEPRSMNLAPVCPSCLKPFGKERPRYCPHCGQRIDWEGKKAAK